eukprot:2285496-Amphidinium_carterae.1
MDPGCRKATLQRVIAAALQDDSLRDMQKKCSKNSPTGRWFLLLLDEQALNQRSLALFVSRASGLTLQAWYSSESG